MSPLLNTSHYKFYGARHVLTPDKSLFQPDLLVSQEFVSSLFVESITQSLSSQSSDTVL